jgi:3-methylcrotonyl-CoA carboxylase alpha subunit
MIQRLLVANRGEIACRIVRTARRMGIHTIAVYSDADKGARHVREADEAVRIGPPPASGSYLDIAAILSAARATAAEAIHPGYGFLSENARFARACRDAGLIFVGPTPAAIEAMGVKSLAKARVRALGVPVLPGYEGERQDIEHLAAQALSAGLPLIVKPAAGGGGKGMRVVRSRDEVREALESARRQAESSFGDGTLLLERYLPEPRHIEVQVFADQHGNCVHLGDRDCSVQRRHQKLIEEAPAPGLADELRERLRRSAVEVARDIRYTGAGTVEFLFDGHEFYFLEMNTRLQVEHTVTEAVTGLDLVEWQLRVAAGEPLPLAQSQIRIDGHAIEARVCAEDPWREFLPSAGVLQLAEWPRGEALRVDAGFAAGDSVPAVYDSLLAKVIAWAPQRERAAHLLGQALERTRLAGVHTNERWLSRILRSRVFLEARHSVALLGQRLEEFSAPVHADAAVMALAALAAQGGAGGRSNPWAVGDGFSPNLPAQVFVTLSAGGCERRVALQFEHGVPRSAIAGAQDPERPGSSIEVADVRMEDGMILAQLQGRWRQARYFRDGSRLHLWEGGAHHEFLIEDPRVREFAASTASGGLTTPLPGVVSAVAVEAGQKVSAGEVLMVIEAMKMEHGITAPFDGVVEAVHFSRGDRVPEGSELLSLSRSADDAA